MSIVALRWYARVLTHLPPISVVLQTFIVGAELAIVRSSHPDARAISWVLFVRFIVMPAIALLFVWGTAGRGWYIDDRLVWYVPSAHTSAAYLSTDNTLPIGSCSS